MPLSYDPQAALVPVKISPFFRDEAQTERQMDMEGKEAGAEGGGEGARAALRPILSLVAYVAHLVRVEASRTLSCSGSCTWRSCLKPASIYMYG